MKIFQAIIIIAGILAIIGIYVAIPAVPASGTLTASIPAGNYYYRIPFNIYKGGRISGTFSETSGNSVAFYMFDSSQYQSFRTEGSATELFATSGATGSFSATISSPGNYYIVLQHGSTGAGQIQNVQITYLVDGMNPVVLGTGVGLILVAVGLGITGYLLKRRAVTPSSLSDVILFDRPT